MMLSSKLVCLSLADTTTLVLTIKSLKFTVIYFFLPILMAFIKYTNFKAKTNICAFYDYKFLLLQLYSCKGH